MNKSLLFVIVLWFGGFGSFDTMAQKAPQLSRLARVYLLNVDPGSDLYAVYGHSALWVSDEINNFSEVYDYGVFDFDAPDFYLNFLMGDLQYKRVQHDLNSFLMTFYMQDREVVAKQIFLDSVAKQKLYDRLWHNSLPGNDTYRYDFVKDNCATQMQDLLDEATDGRIRWHYTDRRSSLRMLLHAEMEAYHWTRFGYDLLLGAGADTLLDGRSHNFLPRYLFRHAGMARYRQGDLCGPDEPMLNTPSPSAEADFWYVSPSAVFGVLGLLVLCSALLGWRIPRGFEMTWFIVLGLLGCLLFFMSNFTAHHVMKQNWNLLWVHPLFLFWTVLLRHLAKPWVRALGKGLLLGVAVALLAGYFLPQTYPMAAYFINTISLLFLIGRLYPKLYNRLRIWQR